MNAFWSTAGVATTWSSWFIVSPSKGVDHAIHAARAAGVKLVNAAKCWVEEEVRYFELYVQPQLGGLLPLSP